MRVAGNVIDDTVLGSVEYAVEHLGASLVVVLGHERCGAVKAALAKDAPPGHVAAIVSRIRTAIAGAKAPSGDVLDSAVRANVAASVRDVQGAQAAAGAAGAKGEREGRRGALRPRHRRRRDPPGSHSADLDEPPFAGLAVDGDLDEVAGAAADERAADRRRGRDHRQEAVAARAGELGAGADGQHDEGALLFAALAFDGDVDDGAERDAALRRERRQPAVPEGGELLQLLLHLARARRLTGRQAAEFDGGAAVFFLFRLGLERARRLARLFAGAACDLVGVAQVGGELLDEEPFVETHGLDSIDGTGGDNFSRARGDRLVAPRPMVFGGQGRMGDEHLQRLRSIADPVALLEGMFAHAPVAYQIYKPDGHCLLVNEAFRQLFGAEPPPEYNVFQDELADANGQLAILKRAFRGETVETTPIWYDARELKQVTIAEARRCAMICTAFPLFDESGAIAHVVFVFKDVTAELQTQERAEAERDLLRAIIEQSGDGIIVADAGGELTIFNRAAAEQHGANGRGLGAARWAELVGLTRLDGEPLPFADFPLQRTLVERAVSEGRWRVRRPDGVARTVSGTAAPITRPDGQGGGAILVTRDETDRLALEAQVGAIGAQLRAIVEHSPNALYLKDLEGRHVWMSPGYERGAGRPVGSFAGKTAREVFPPEMAAVMEENDRRVIETRAPVTAEETVPEHDGLHTYLTAKFPVLDAAGTPIAIGGLSTDITAIKQAQQRLRQSEERFTLYFQVSPFPAAITSMDGRILDINPAGERFAGLLRSQVVGRNGAELNLWLRSEDRQRVADLMARDGRVRDHEAIVETPDGVRHHILLSIERMEIDGEPRMLSMMHDVTEHVRLQDELRQSQKMEAVGRLAGGVAHDFNNLLTALSGYNSLLLAALPAGDERRGFAERVAQAAGRASALTNQLLAFSRKQPVAIEDLDINEVIGSIADMLRRLIGEDVALVSELSPRLDSVRADRAQIEQVIVNLVVNARDAMPHGGRVTLTTANVRVEHERLRALRRARHRRRHRSAGAGAAVRAVLHDQGAGQGHRPGAGDGVRHRQAGGRAGARRERAGRAARCSRCCCRASTSVAAAKLPAAERVEPPRGKGTILLVEDDESVRDFVGFVLRQQGYACSTPRMGRSALAIARGACRRDRPPDQRRGDAAHERVRSGGGAASVAAGAARAAHLRLSRAISRAATPPSCQAILARDSCSTASASSSPHVEPSSRSLRRAAGGDAGGGAFPAGVEGAAGLVEIDEERARGRRGSACPSAPRGRSRRPSIRAATGAVTSR